MSENQEKTKIKNPIWLSVSEASKLGGVKDKTIRRALKNEGALKFKINNNRYQIELNSLFNYLHRNKKLANKFRDLGLGQYFPEIK